MAVVEEHAVLADAQHGGRVRGIDGAGPEAVGNKNNHIARFGVFFFIAMLICGKGGNGQQKNPYETQGRSATHRFLLTSGENVKTRQPWEPDHVDCLPATGSAFSCPHAL